VKKIQREGRAWRKVHKPDKQRSGVKQGYVMSPKLFFNIIDWIMKKVTDNKTGIT
jgi:hypothetical protein